MQCKGKPPLLDGRNSPEAVQERVVAHIESIVRKLNAGTLDLHQLDYFDWLLLEIYRDEERNQESIFKAKLAAAFEAMSKQAG